MGSKLVSVIIPCYNNENELDASIGSVYGQDWSALELIVIDDGSKDNSAAVVKSWVRRFEEKQWRLIYRYQENEGLGGAINTGIKLVSGDYLTLLDADDRYLEGAIPKKAEFLDRNPDYALVRNNGWVVINDRRWLFVNDEEEKKSKDIFEMLITGKTNNWAGSYMLRTEVLFRFYPDREIYASRYGQNLQLLLPVSYKNLSGFIDEPLMEYIQSDNSLSRDSDPLVKKEKLIRNARGYADIRRHMLTLFDIDTEQKIRWNNLIEANTNRMLLNIGIENNDKHLMKLAIYNLKQSATYGLTDRIHYWQNRFMPFAYLLRAFRKVKTSLHM